MHLQCGYTSGGSVEKLPYDPMDAASDEVKSVSEAERNYQDMVEKVKQESKKLDELKKTRTD